MYDMAANLSTSVQDTDSDVSLINLEESRISERDTDSDVSLINLKEIKRYQPLLGEKGYNLVEKGSDEQVDDHLLAISDPQGRAMNLGRNRMTLGQRNEDHYRAWLSADNAQTDDVLQDELDETNDVSDPSLLEEVQPTTCLRDLERNDLQAEKRHGETVAITKTKTRYTPKEQALEKKEFTQYTVCLVNILLSDGDGWIFCLDDIIQINRDVMTDLADRHAKSIVYGDVRAGNIFLNDYMKAFLISSDKSKKQKNETALREESIVDVKAMCKVMGGLCTFYMRMKPRDSQKKAETALFALLRRGYRDGISAKDFLEVLRRIVVDDQVNEEEVPDAVSNQVPDAVSNQVPDAVSNQVPDAVSNQVPDAVSNQAPVPASGANNEGPGNNSRDTTGELDSREMEVGYSTDGASIRETLMADMEMEMFQSK